MKVKIAETYPLRLPKSYAEVLLVSFPDCKPCIQDKVGFKCDDVYMEDNGMNLVRDRVFAHKEKGKAFYKYIIVDLDDISIIIERFGRGLKKLFLENKMDLKKVRLYAFSSTDSEKIEQHCTRGGFRFFLKPDKANYLDMFRHMADETLPIPEGGASVVSPTKTGKHAKRVSQ